MATAKKRRKKKPQRPVEQYIAAARELSPLVPKLKKYRKRKTLKPHEKGAITRKEKQLKGVTNLFPVTKKQARKIGKSKMFAPGVQAIRLRNVDPETATISINKYGDISVTQAGRKWIYWALDRETVRSRPGMRKAGTDAFGKKFPIELVSDMAKIAFDKLHVQGVSLWTHGGRADAVFDDLPAFIRWVNEKWSAGRYMHTNEYGELQDSSDPGKWVSGIAILIEDAEYTARRNSLKQGQTANDRENPKPNPPRNRKHNRKGRSV